jgi:hypothetical protein
MGEKRNEYRVLVGRPEGRRPFVRPCLDGRLLLNWILNLIHGGSFKWYLPDECLQFNLYLPKQTVLTTAMCIKVPNGQFCPILDI